MLAGGMGGVGWCTGVCDGGGMADGYIEGCGWVSGGADAAR